MATLGSALLALILLTVGTWTASARCPIGTTQGLSSTECYVYKSTQVTWPQAEAECASHGGHLSSIRNKTHNYFLLKMPNLQCASSYWVGGNFDRTVANQWAWVDKAGFTYRNWATGQPATSKCMIYQAESSGQWKTQSCPTPRPFICKLPSIEQSICPTCPSFGGCPTSKPKSMCDEGWVYFGPTKTCLKVLHGVGTWDQYETKCTDLGGHLATVHSMDEMNFIKELTSSSVPYNLYIWIGYRNGACGSAYTWADGSKSNYTNWGKAQPDCYGGNEHCAHIFSDLEQDPSPSVWGWTRGQWNDLSCYGQAHGGVCAKAVTTFI